MKGLKYFSSLAIIFSILISWSCTSNSTADNIALTPADSLAVKIQEAIHYDDWVATPWVSWTFGDRRTFLLDKERNFVEVVWDNNTVLLNIANKDGKAMQDEVEVKEDSLKKSMLEQAWSFYCNDEFWLNAPAKLFADGTERSLVQDQDTTKLKVIYNTGGVTPGDIYVWSFDENYLPTAYEMTVSVIPQPGFRSSWEGWQTLASGAKISTEHQMGERILRISNVKSGDSYKDFNRSTDPFQAITK